MATKHPLRRSCAFCRARKIKCSNETICEACRRQGVDCIYDFELPRPKSRTISLDSTRMDPSMIRNGDVGFGHHRKRSTSGASPYPSPPGPVCDDSFEPYEVTENVAAALEQQFHGNFNRDDAGHCSSPWQERIDAYHQALHDRPENMTARFTPNSVKYTGILSLLTNDLAGLATGQFGSLGCHHIEEGGAQFFLSGIASDNTQTMFDTSSFMGNPLSKYGQRQRTQLIDVWYSFHPLSFLISKTLLLRELRDGTHDEILLAVMLADSHFSIGDDVSISRGHTLVQWAMGKLRNRPLRSSQVSSNGTMSTGISTRIFNGISTVQALVLLAWNALCSSQLRRTICFIDLAGQLASEIKHEMANSTGPMSSSRINGIDVFDVEKEIIAYLYWTTYSLSLWAFIQMGSGHFSQILSSPLSSVSLPVTEADSVIIQLDLVSENFSTLQKQKKVVREMWPLAHISSIIAYIFTLFPRSDAHNVPTMNPWQNTPSLALDGVPQGNPSRDSWEICQEINEVLMERIQTLKMQVNETSSLSLVLAVYQTMAIQFLFPVSSSSRTEESINAEVVEAFCSSAEEILQLFKSISNQPQDLYSISPSLRSSFPDVFCLALDTCARALSTIAGPKHTHLLGHSNLNTNPRLDYGHGYDSAHDFNYMYDAFINSTPMERQWAQVDEPRLEALTSQLYVMSQTDFLNQGKSIRLVRRLLRARVRAFGGSPVSDSSGSPSPVNIRAVPLTPLSSLPVPSSSDSDHLSTATTAARYSNSPSVSPMDTSKMTSAVPAPSIVSSEVPTANQFVSFDDLSKPDWQSTNTLFQDIMNSSTSNTSSANNPYVGELVGVQAWCPPMPAMMDFEMVGHGSMLGGQWDWPDLGIQVAAAESDVDPSLHYFSKGYDKRR